MGDASLYFEVAPFAARWCSDKNFVQGISPEHFLPEELAGRGEFSHASFVAKVLAGQFR
jgi:hypothetical protein